MEGFLTLNTLKEIVLEANTVSFVVGSAEINPALVENWALVSFEF